MPEPFKDRVNVALAGFVFLVSFVVYSLTVQPTLSYWDCGEFIACSYILGIPHPPGFPLFVVIGRLFSLIPFAEDICYRVNMLSVLSSAVAVMFAYLTLVRMIRLWYKRVLDSWKKYTAYIGGVSGSLLMAFASTYWANAVEAEVYGLSLMFMSIIMWLTVKYLDHRETGEGSRLIIMVCFLAVLGISIHLTTFLILPVTAIFFILKKNAPPKAWFAVCGFLIAELLAILAFSTSGGGYKAFIFVSILLLLAVAFIIYRYINWPIMIAIGGFSMVMLGYYPFIYGIIVSAVAMFLFSKYMPHSDWKTGLAVVAIAFLGYSFHFFIPIRSGQNPRIDENNADRDFTLSSLIDYRNPSQFIYFLERKQYGSESMVERMFKRRGLLKHQFGRHAHMGFWSYFEKQYGLTPIFGLLFLLGIFGMGYAAWKKYEIGLPFLTLILLASVGLVLYMNFADGCRYDPQRGDAYLEVRNRDYFYTPAYAYFGLAIGMGIAALMDLTRRGVKSEQMRKYAMTGVSLLVFLPAAAIADNWHENDRSNNYFPKIYSMNILDTCEENAILFTSGDNDTFPLWCVQEVYEYRKDVRVVNLSLLNTDWYIWQMKQQYGVPISLKKDQIEWKEFKSGDRVYRRPPKPYIDRSRNKRRYLIPIFDPDEGRASKLQDLMVDEIYIENNWKYPMYFSSEPYAESPLNLRDKSVAVGVLYRLDTAQYDRRIDGETGLKLFYDTYQFDGLDKPSIYRDENATGVMLGLGFNAVRIASDLAISGDTAAAKEILHFTIERYPEFYPAYTTLVDFYRRTGDSATADSILHSFEPVIKELVELDSESQFYLSDYGLYLYDTGDIMGGIDYLRRAFDVNRNSGYAFRKMVQILYQKSRISELREVTFQHAQYGANLNDTMLRSLLDAFQRGPAPTGMPAPPPVTTPPPSTQPSTREN